MKYKIQVYLNRVGDEYKEDFEKARLYHLKHGVDIEFTFNTCDVHGYRSVLYTHANKFKQYLLLGADSLVSIDKSADATLFAFDMNEWATPAGSPYPLKPETPNGSCLILNQKPFITVGVHPSEKKSGQTWIQIAHEIMHSYVQNALLKGIVIRDVMDTYFFNSEPENILSNFSEQWQLLQPYLTFTPVVLTRLYDYQGTEIVGRLDYGTFYANTLERSWVNNLSNISAIPKGTYTCKWTFSTKFMKYTYEVMNVSGRTGIRIHSASFWSDLLGCIALGKGYASLNKDDKPDLMNSRQMVEEFNSLMNKKDFTLVIK